VEWGGEVARTKWGIFAKLDKALPVRHIIQVFLRISPVCVYAQFLQDGSCLIICHGFRDVVYILLTTCPIVISMAEQIN
jgi:hypothetical protein